MQIEREIGTGPESVYAYYFPSQATTSSFPHKIGKTKGDPIRRIRAQQASMQEAPVIGTLVRTDNAFALEAQLHLYLKDRRLPAYGAEWFDIHPNAIQNCIEDGLPELAWYDQLQYHRLAAGLSQAELARRAGMRQATVSAIENGANAGIHSVIRLCKELHLRMTFVPSE